MRKIRVCKIREGICGGTGEPECEVKQGWNPAWESRKHEGNMELIKIARPD